jgi:hypothetical protein
VRSQQLQLRVAAAVKRNDQMRKGKERSSVCNPAKKCFNKHTNIPVIKATLPPLDGGFTSASSECSWNGDLLAMSRARGGWSWSAEAEMIACGAWSADVCCASERECGHGMVKKSRLSFLDSHRLSVVMK